MQPSVRGSCLVSKPHTPKPLSICASFWDLFTLDQQHENRERLGIYSGAMDHHNAPPPPFDDRGHQIIILSCVLHAISIPVLFARIWSRSRPILRLGWDDWAIITAAVSRSHTTPHFREPFFTILLGLRRRSMDPPPHCCRSWARPSILLRAFRPNTDCAGVSLLCQPLLRMGYLPCEAQYRLFPLPTTSR